MAKPVRSSSNGSEVMTPYQRRDLALKTLTLVVEFLGFTVLIVSLQLSTAAFKATTYSNANSWILRLDEAFLQKPHLRPYFYSGAVVDNKNKVRYEETRGMAEYILDTYETFLRHRFPNGITEKDAGWKNWICASFDNSPILREYFEERKEWYTPSIILKLYNEDCSKQEAISK